MTFSLKQLRYAAALAETGHFGQAAARCDISQPALSQQIQLLEASCGMAIFDRRGKTVRPTPFGLEFLARARIVLAQCAELEAFATSRSGAPTRPLRFGVIPTVAPYLLPEIFPALRETFPALGFTISESRTDALLAGLDDSSLDLALIATDPPATGPRLAVAPLFDDSFVLAIGDTDDVVEPVPLAGLEPRRMLLLDEGHCFRDQALAACGLNSEIDRNTFAATSLSTIVEFVANGQGITLLPEIALAKEATNRRIHIRRLAAPGAARTLSLVWRETSPFAAIFTDIAETIRRTRASTIEAMAIARAAPAA